MKESFDIIRFSQVINAVTESCDRILETAAKRSGVTKREADVLLFFFNNTEYQFSTDAVKLRGFSCESVAEALFGLEKRGLIETAASGTSAMKVSVTGKGGIIAKSLNSALDKHFTKLMSGVTSEEEAVFKRILNTVYSNSLKF